MSEQQKQLEQQLNSLKIRLFDTEEAYRSLDKTFGEFAKALADLLKLDKEQAQNLDSYIEAINALIDSEEGSAKEE